MVEFTCDLLESRGYVPVLAYYEPYSLSPELSTPLFAPFRRPGARRETSLGGREAWAIGAWFPELEFTHYSLTRHWQRVIDSCELHLVVSGNCLAATALVESATPFLGWIATGWEEDRRDRVARFPWARRQVDRAVNAPRIRRLEREVLAGGTFLAISQHTRDGIRELSGGRIVDVLPVPVDGATFTPAPSVVVQGRIAFVGRLDDPRKNTGLLLDAQALLRRRGVRVELVLVGYEPGGPLDRRLRSSRDEGVTGHPRLDPEELVALLRTVDVFAVPSHQEGLCVAALEAMASGCPVVSTRCGGPEEFVLDGETGFLADSTPESMALTVQRVVEDRRLRQAMSRNARRLVEESYSVPRATALFWRAFDARFGTCGARNLEERTVSCERS